MKLGIVIFKQKYTYIIDNNRDCKGSCLTYKCKIAEIEWENDNFYKSLLFKV